MNNQELFNCTITPYEKQLQKFCNFTKDEANLILKLYNKVDIIFSTENTLQKAWRYARLLSSFCYDDIFIGIINQWDNLDDCITTNEGKETYFRNTLGYTASEYTASEYNTLKNGLIHNHGVAFDNDNIIDFAHLQYSLAARLAYVLNKSEPSFICDRYFWINDYQCYSDEEISYLVGWLGDAVLIDVFGTEETTFNNTAYMSDLDAENIFRLIMKEKTVAEAITEYYSDMALHNNRATIFLQHIPLRTVKEKIFCELIGSYLIQEYKVKKNILSDIINYEDCLWDSLESFYPDTYNFLKSLEERSSTLKRYTENIYWFV